jgi:hydroxymethylpyrimidine/phosphomethylpyrimidine kinase
MKVVLSIAGSDSSGGAGIQADLKTFEAFGVFGCTVITVLTAQNTTGVRNIQRTNSLFIKDQMEAILEDFDIAAIKIGMLFSNDIIDTIKDCIKDLKVPIVLDPVSVSKAGSKLLSEDAMKNIKTLFSYATVITPNLFEAKALFDYNPKDKNSTNELLQQPYNILIKNHARQEEDETYSIDTLFMNQEQKDFQTPYIDTHNTHGTGCSFSSAIAANLALGHPLEKAIDISNNFIYHAIKHAPGLGQGKGPIAHKTAATILKES